MPRAKRAKERRQISSCCFDLETTGLNANFGVVLCGVILPANKNPVVFRHDKLAADWQGNRSDDSAVVAAIITELNKYDVWVAHNGDRFDVPFLRTRALRHNMPALPNNKKLIDPLQLARNKLRMRYNSLNEVANLLDCNSKTDLKPEVWLRAQLDGDKRSMDYIVKHCIEDVWTLERIVAALVPYSSAFNSWGSGR